MVIINDKMINKGNKPLFCYKNIRMGGVYMRKYFSICIVFIFLFSFSGCKNESTNSKTKELVVITDYQLKNAVDNMADYYMQKYPDIKIKVEMPSEETVQEHSADIQKWNTKILAGKGPDVYLLSADYEHYVYEKGMEEKLIKNVDKTMRSGAFASLSSYMEKDPFWKNTNYNKNILEAGKYNGKQYVLPITCQYFGVIGAEKYTVPEVKNLKELREYVTNPHLILFASARWMQPAMDYKKGEVLFDKEEWAKFAKEYLEADFVQKTREKYESFDLCRITEVPELKAKECIALPNLNGKKIAAIEQYGAIGMSSKYKKEAYEFLMLFFNDEFEKEKPEGNSSIRQMIASSALYISDSDDYFQENPLVFSSYQQLEGAYFPTDVERFIYEEIFKIQVLPTNDVPDDLKEQCDTLADTIYEKYRMIVEE